MNYCLLTELFSRSREYAELLSDIKAEYAFGRFKPFRVQGLTDGASRTMLASVCRDYLRDAAERGDSGVLILVPDEKEAGSVADFLSDCGFAAARFPARDYNFNNITASHEYEHERLRVLSDLVNDARLPIVVVSTPEAVMQVTMPQSMMRENIIKIEYDKPLDTAALAKKLVSSGYSRVDMVEGCGQFAVRGGIIDIFTPCGEPYRIELFGDEIDRLGTFDPMTQRFTESADGSVTIPPAREIIVTDDVREKLSAMIRAQIKRAAKDQSVDPRVIEELGTEVAQLDAGIIPDCIDKYLPTVYPDGSFILDYFCGLLVFSDTAHLEERANASYDITMQSVSDLIESGEIMPQRSIFGHMRKMADIYAACENMPSLLLDAFARAAGDMKIGGSYDFAARHVTSYSGNMALLKEDIAGFTASDVMIAVLCATEPEAAEVIAALNGEGMTAAHADSVGAEYYMRTSGRYPIAVLTGEYFGGYELASPKFALLDFSSSSQKPSTSLRRRKNAKQKKNTERILSYADMEVGDIVVHAVYGIGQFMGIETLTAAGTTRDYIKINYAGTDKLFLPVDQLEMVSKYIGAGADTGAVKLSKMGGADWNRAKSKAKGAAKEMAHELVELYARRKRTPGYAFDPDDDMCRQFADSFEYEETDGQTAAINDIRRDMEAPYPMDRLLCGDVGYGKTEVAFRAAFKAVMSGKQVAILVPTTILAAQHYQTAMSRMRGFPVNIDMLSRFRTPTEQAASVRKLRRGDTDIIIGTHRLLSKDIEFADLGLVIVDEEQRFGVAQKERLKQISKNADVLTLTATPIPRTLNMAMSGILDMSILEEAPGARVPVQTYVMEQDDAILTEAMRRELRRGGQVFYLHNNTENVYTVAAKIAKALPDARVTAAHGKMDREELEDIWAALVAGEIDILVSTTIIETGIDLPNANTLIIENADHYGLSQLHQIRGRVGRSSRRAYAYFTYPPNKLLTEIAEKRLSAIKEYAAFGAGFKIALRDLEIRGAGNLLGAEQHGHLDAIGYDLYIKLLNEAVLEEKGEEVPKPKECTVNFTADAYLPQNYVTTAAQRMEMYKRIAHIANYEDYEDVLDEICDRYGEAPREAMNLMRISMIRALGIKAGFTKIEERDGTVCFYPDKVDAAAWSIMAREFPLAGIRMSLGASPFAVCRMKKGQNAIAFATELITKYICVTAVTDK